MDALPGCWTSTARPTLVYCRVRMHEAELRVQIFRVLVGSRNGLVSLLRVNNRCTPYGKC